MDNKEVKKVFFDPKNVDINIDREENIMPQFEPEKEYDPFNDEKRIHEEISLEVIDDNK